MNKYSHKRLELANTSLLYFLLNKTEHILQNNKCDKCRLTIHPNFIGYHKCGYANCPICKNAITNSQYWFHIRSHPGHENDSPPRPRETTFNSRQRTGTQHSTQRWS
jgi:hypothetical protein